MKQRKFLMRALLLVLSLVVFPLGASAQVVNVGNLSSVLLQPRSTGDEQPSVKKDSKPYRRAPQRLVIPSVSVDGENLVFESSAFVTLAYEVATSEGDVLTSGSFSLSGAMAHREPIFWLEPGTYYIYVYIGNTAYAGMFIKY